MTQCPPLNTLLDVHVVMITAIHENWSGRLAGRVTRRVEIIQPAGQAC